MFLDVGEEINKGGKKTKNWINTSDSFLARGARKVVLISPLAKEEESISPLSKEGTKQDMQKTLENLMVVLPSLSL